MNLPPSRRPGHSQRHPRLSALFGLRCTCGASDWVLLRSLEPDEDGRCRAYGCRECGARIDTRESEAYPVTPLTALYCRAISMPDAPCLCCGETRLRRCTYPAYDALLAHTYTCLSCGYEWRTAEVLIAGPRAPLPRSARRAARRHALGRGA